MLPEIRQPEDADLVTLRRSDLAALRTAYQAALRSRGLWISGVAGIGGLLLGATLIILGENLGWPAALSPLFFAGGWAILIGAFVSVTVRTRRIRVKYAFRCPACGDLLLGAPRPPSGTPRADVAIATGCCPSCGARILAADE